MRVFVDYNLELRDVQIANEWKICILLFIILAKIKLLKGFHSILIQFAKWIDESNNSDNIFLKLETIYVDGVRNADYECNKCVNSFSKKGSDSCYFCKSNFYLNERNVIQFIINSKHV